MRVLRQWDNGCHIDWQVTESDFDATPRRDLLALWSANPPARLPKFPIMLEWLL